MSLSAPAIELQAADVSCRFCGAENSAGGGIHLSEMVDFDCRKTGFTPEAEGQ